MGWKKKEKALTTEEAIEKAKETVKPYWYHSAPLIAGMENDGKYSVYPLSEDFSKKAWLILFIDITTDNTSDFLKIITQWIDEYASFDLNFMIIIKASGEYCKDKDFINLYMEDFELNIPIVVDYDHTIQKAMSIESHPTFVFLNKGKKLFTDQNPESLHNTENYIQNFLRKSDPGLPLPPARMGIPTRIRHVKGIEFNASSNFKLKLLKKDPKADELAQTLSESTAFLTGNWKRDVDKLWTDDKKAKIYFLVKNSRFSILASSLSKLYELSKVIVEVDGTPAYSAFSGDDLSTDDDGHSCVSIRKSKSYSIFKDLPKDKNLVTFKFVNADRIPVALYGFRFSENQ